MIFIVIKSQCNGKLIKIFVYSRLVKPFCSTRKIRGIYVGRQETVKILCNVTANPTPTHFR